MSAIERDLAALSGEPITIRISGREVKVKPYTPRILGKLTAWLKSNGTHPVASVRPLLKDCSPAERDAILKAAVREASENWPPQMGSAQANELFGSGKGLIAFLEITLSPANPELTKADYEAMGEDISMRDYTRLVVALAGKDPLLEEAKKDIEDGQDPNGGDLRGLTGEDAEEDDGPFDWAQWLEEARRGLECPSYEPLLDMTLPQLANIARGGKPETARELDGEAEGEDFRTALMIRHGLDPNAPLKSLAEEEPHADG